MRCYCFYYCCCCYNVLGTSGIAVGPDILIVGEDLKSNQTGLLLLYLFLLTLLVLLLFFFCRFCCSFYSCYCYNFIINPTITTGEKGDIFVRGLPCFGINKNNNNI